MPSHLAYVVTVLTTFVGCSIQVLGQDQGAAIGQWTDENRQESINLVNANRRLAWRYDFSLRRASDTFSINNANYREGLTMLAVPGFVLALLCAISALFAHCLLRKRVYQRRGICHFFSIIAMLLGIVCVAFSIVVINYSEQSSADVIDTHQRITEVARVTTAQLQMAVDIINGVSSSINLIAQLVDNTLEKFVDIATMLRDGNELRNAFTVVVFVIIIFTNVLSPIIMFHRNQDKVALRGVGLVLAGAAAIFALLHFASVVAICDACDAVSSLLDQQANGVQWLVCPTASDGGLGIAETIIRLQRDIECRNDPFGQLCGALDQALQILSNGFSGCHDLVSAINEAHETFCLKLIRSLDLVVISSLITMGALLLWTLAAALSGSREKSGSLGSKEGLSEVGHFYSSAEVPMGPSGRSASVALRPKSKLQPPRAAAAPRGHKDIPALEEALANRKNMFHIGAKVPESGQHPFPKANTFQQPQHRRPSRRSQAANPSLTNPIVIYKKPKGGPQKRSPQSRRKSQERMPTQPRNKRYHR